jgi:hypothetical protein
MRSEVQVLPGPLFCRRNDFLDRRGGREIEVKKIILLVAAVGAGLFVVKKRRDAQSEADLWREATSGSDLS